MMLAPFFGRELGLLKMVVVGWVRLKIPLPQVWILQTSLGDLLVPLQECIIMLPYKSLHKSLHILTLYKLFDILILFLWCQMPA